MSQVKRILSRVFKRGQPDVYQAMKTYAEKKGIPVSDVIAAACSGYLASDEDEGKEILEQAMSELKSKGRGGKGDLKEATAMFKEMCGAMGDMFTVMNTARSSLQASSLITDYKAVASAAAEIKKLGGESGGGSIEDVFAEKFIENLLGGKMRKTSKSKKKTGKAKVEDIGED